jgi:cobalt/nickel transport protein
MTHFQKKLWIGLILIALLSPLGIILPEQFNAGTAWGEWGMEALEKLLGYVPEGLKRYAGLWKAPVAGYQVGGNDSAALQLISYVASGIFGMIAVALLVYGISKLLAKHEK